MPMITTILSEENLKDGQQSPLPQSLYDDIVR